MSDATVNNLQPKASEVAPALKVRSYWQTVGYRLRYDYMTLFFGFVVILIILSAIFAPLLAPMDPYQSSMLNRLKPIGYKDFILGTDELGRDILSRILYGGRISLTMGILPVFIATVIGGLLGIIAGFVGGRTNMTIMRIMDVFYAFPSILSSGGHFRRPRRGHFQRHDVADLGVHPAALPRRRDRHLSGAQSRLCRSRAGDRGEHV